MAKPGRKAVFIPENLDWTQPTAHLAQTLGCSKGVIQRIRNAKAMKPPVRANDVQGILAKVTDYEWGTTRSRPLARKLGISPYAVRVYRAKHNKPKYSPYRKQVLEIESPNKLEGLNWQPKEA